MITQVSNSFFNLLQAFEGFVSCPYKDSGGVWTIGIGTTKYPDGRPVQKGDGCISQNQAILFAKNDVSYIEKFLTALHVELTQNQFNALASLAYNIGTGALSRSTLLKKVIKNPNDLSIGAEFEKWCYDNKVINKGLLIRRRKERDIYFQA